MKNTSGSTGERTSNEVEKQEDPLPVGWPRAVRVDQHWFAAGAGPRIEIRITAVHHSEKPATADYEVVGKNRKGSLGVERLLSGASGYVPCPPNE